MASTKTMESQAIIATPPTYPGHTPAANWSLSPILVPTTLPPGTLLVEMTATGICHTDFLITSAPASRGHIKYPRVAGHEGAGFIKSIGPDVANKDLREGDPVLLSFTSCGKCKSCGEGRTSYCSMFAPLNYFGKHDALRTKEGGDLAGQFFGQSSFANLSVVSENCVVPAKDVVRAGKEREELKLFAPLGCGLQTGAGAVLNIAKPDEKSSVMVAGLGGVGLGAVMAAKIVGCKEITGVDRIASRVSACKDLGATSVLDTSNITAEGDLTKALKEAANGGNGPDVFVDTTGSPAVQIAAFNALANNGILIFIGHNGNPMESMTFNLSSLMNRGIRLVGCIEGDSAPKDFIPKLVKYYREGKFPIDRIMRYYKAEDFKTALRDMHSGEAIKAVLEW